MKISIDESRHLAGLIKRLEKYDPNDDFPAATRGTLAYMRILESNGPEELLNAIHANIAASVAVLAVLSPTPLGAVKAYMELTGKVMREMQQSIAAAATEGTPK